MKKEKRFIKLPQALLDTTCVYVDRETRVQYLWVIGGGLTVLVDANGDPLLYDGELPD